MKLITYTLLLALFLGSCTVEKRLYNRGYHVEFRQNGKVSKEHTTNVRVVDSKEVQQYEHSEIASNVAQADIKEQLVTEVEPEVVPSVQSNQEKQLYRAKQQVRPIAQVSLPTIRNKKEVRLSDDPQVSKNGSSVKQEKAQNKQRTRREISLSEEAFEFLAGAVLLTILLLCLAFPTFGAIVEMIVGIILLILLVVGVVWVIVWLCTADFNFPWFWSGR